MKIIKFGKTQLTDFSKKVIKEQIIKKMLNTFHQDPFNFSVYRKLTQVRTLKKKLL